MIYLLVTGAYGCVVGAKIHQIKAENPLIGFGANIIGRDVVEDLTIRDFGIGSFFTTSPAFWIGLRLTE